MKVHCTETVSTEGAALLLADNVHEPRFLVKAVCCGRPTYMVASRDSAVLAKPHVFGLSEVETRPLDEPQHPTPTTSSRIVQRTDGTYAVETKLLGDTVQQLRGWWNANHHRFPAHYIRVKARRDRNWIVARTFDHGTYRTGCATCRIQYLGIDQARAEELMTRTILGSSPTREELHELAFNPTEVTA